MTSWANASISNRNVCGWEETSCVQLCIAAQAIDVHLPVLFWQRELKVSKCGHGMCLQDWCVLFGSATRHLAYMRMRPTSNVSRLQLIRCIRQNLRPAPTNFMICRTESLACLDARSCATIFQGKWPNGERIPLKLPSLKV